MENDNGYLQYTTVRVSGLLIMIYLMKNSSALVIDDYFEG